MGFVIKALHVLPDSLVYNVLIFENSKRELQY